MATLIDQLMLGLPNELQQALTLQTFTTATTSASSSTPAIERAIHDLRRDLYDGQAWATLLSKCETLKVADMRSLIEAFLTVFPSSSQHWRYYAQAEMAAHNYTEAEQIFGRCLLRCYDVELWRAYLHYMQQVKYEQPDYADAMIQAYEFVLQHMQADIDAGSIWLSYIALLKSFVKEAANAFSEEGGIDTTSSKQSALRAVYQRAVAMPFDNVDEVFRDWDQWEHNLNKQDAPRLLQEAQVRHGNAKVVARERKRKRMGLMPHMLARPARSNSQALHRDSQQTILWKRLINYEMSNPSRLEMRSLRQRIIFTFKQALLPCRHNAELWLNYVEYVDAVDECRAIWREAKEAMPYSTLIYLLHADWEERRGNTSEARAVFLELTQRPLELLPFINWPMLSSNITLQPMLSSTYEDRNSLEYDHSKTGLICLDPLSLICQNRFVRRVEGIDAARKSFLMARKANAPWQVWVHAALTEFYTNKEANVAGKVFAHAMQNDAFTKDPLFLHQYATFLHGLNDQNNMRLIMERAFNSFSVEEKLIGFADVSDVRTIDLSNTAGIMNDLFDQFVDFERYASVDLMAVEKAEMRRDEARGVAFHKIDNLIDRWRFLNLLPCSAAFRSFVKMTSPAVIDSASISNGVGRLGFGRRAADGSAEMRKAMYARPDLSKLTEFNPLRISTPDKSKLKSKYGNFPDVISDLLEALNRLGQYGGSLLDIDKLLVLLKKVPEPETLNLSPLYYDLLPEDRKRNFEDSKSDGETGTSGHGPSQSTQPSIESDARAPPVDIFRQRRQQKLLV